MLKSNPIYGKGTKYGYVNIYGETIIEAKFDDYEVDIKNDIICFLEYPQFRYKKESNFFLQLDGVIKKIIKKEVTLTSNTNIILP
ncbi:hypothetical protein [Xanthomarina gelatinilytica]|uniref:hypothetical protein n=1 Tax=Xanthomarina gelatinilytica TaxID=1137281 RepID=UPI003AA9E24D